AASNRRGAWSSNSSTRTLQQDIVECRFKLFPALRMTAIFGEDIRVPRSSHPETSANKRDDRESSWLRPGRTLGATPGLCRPNGPAGTETEPPAHAGGSC